MSKCSPSLGCTCTSTFWRELAQGICCTGEPITSLKSWPPTPEGSSSLVVQKSRIHQQCWQVHRFDLIAAAFQHMYCEYLLPPDEHCWAHWLTFPVMCCIHLSLESNLSYICNVLQQFVKLLQNNHEACNQFSVQVSECSAR